MFSNETLIAYSSLFTYNSLLKFRTLCVLLAVKIRHTMQQYLIPVCLTTDSKRFLRVDHEFGI